MNISLSLQWLTSDDRHHHIEPELFKLLESMQKKASLRQASLKHRLSYRHAWGLIKKWEAAFNRPLLRMKRGRNADSELTDFALALLEQREHLKHQFKSLLDIESNRINQSLGLNSKVKKDELRFFASHDLAVTKLNDLIQQDYPGNWKTETHGSLDALKQLANGLCEIIGFHYPLTSEKLDLIEEYQSWLELAECSMVELTVRSQGLIIPKNNPKKIQHLNDLTKRSVRFINRQTNSGTRILFDELLKRDGISEKLINGYQLEEFTHVAVAAMVASGAADVGMGIQAAAKKFDLGFIPIMQERYVLAFHHDIPASVKHRFIQQLHSKTFQDYIQSLPGYAAENCGRDISLTNLFS